MLGGFGSIQGMINSLKANKALLQRRNFMYDKDNPEKVTSYPGRYVVNIPKLSEEEIAASIERLRIERKKSLRYDFIALFATLAFLFLVFLFFYKILI